MSRDDDLLADFLIETEELIAALGQQVMDMEQTPDDADLLNAVFRSFHTVKGGAGFLDLTPMVALCHTAEELCNGLRTGRLSLNADMVDALSAAVDHLQEQHHCLSAGESVPVADPVLLETLHGFSHPQEAVADVAAGDATAVADDMISDDDFEALLDQIHGVATPPAQPVEAGESEPVTAAPPAAESSAPPPNASAMARADRPADERASVAPPPKPPTGGAKAHAGAATPRKPAEKPVIEATIRVETRRLDAVMNLVGELVLARNQLKMLAKGRPVHGGQDEVGKVAARLDGVTTELQNAVMKMRMQAIRKVFSRFPKIVRDLARTLGKDVRLELAGEDTELDKNLVEALADPLIHLVRNSVDHGVEMPERRRAAGKPEQGVVRLSARQEGDDIVILIEDDGGGMDPNVLRARAIERGVLEQDQAARMDAQDCFRIIFMPGFSTRDEVSEVSGRGVGMDVVKTRIDQLNGQIHLDSTLGEGTRMELRVPLTLAIMASLMVRIGERIFAVPLSGVDDVLMFQPEQVTMLDGRRVYMLDGEPLRILVLGMWCGEYADLPERAHLVMIRHGTERFGIVVDSVIGREEVVIKPLGPPLLELAGFSGATVTGDGRVALILDPISLLKILRQRSLVD